MSSNGTYVALRVLPPSGNQLYEFCRGAGILVNKPTFENRLHITVIYSKKPVSPWIVPDTETVHVAEFKDYDLFDWQPDDVSKKVLVVKLTAPSITARHLKLMADHGASYDFPVYQPHITLSSSFRGDIKKLPPIDFPIYAGQEYAEELHP